MRLFGCAYCASPGIVVPTRLEDMSEIRCQCCGAVVGTWAELKERARKVAQASGSAAVCGDPLTLSER